MKDLFLNTFAAAKCIAVFEARERISKMVWDVCSNQLQEGGYTSKELKEAFDMFCECKLQGVYDSGCLEIRGREYNFFKILLS